MDGYLTGLLSNGTTLEFVRISVVLKKISDLNKGKEIFLW